MTRQPKKGSQKNKVMLGAVIASFVILFISGVPQQYLRKIWKPRSAPTEAASAAQGDQLAQLTNDIQLFGDYIKGVKGVEISVIRPEKFEIRCVGDNPSSKSTLEFSVIRIEGEERLTEADFGRRLELQCSPATVTARFEKIRQKSPGEWSVVVGGVSGKGKVGLSIDHAPPTYFDVALTKIWAVPVRACTDDLVFVGNEAQGLAVGGKILGSSEYCGYRVLGIDPSCVWFEAFYGDAPPGDALPTDIWPTFAYVDFQPPVPESGRLVFRKGRYFWPGEAIRLPSGEYLIQISRLIRPNAVHFRLLGRNFLPIRDLVCVIVRPSSL